jgi:hypothetical protein
MKIRPVTAELFHADRWTDMMKPIVAFRNFAKAPRNALAPSGIRTLDRPVHNPVTIPTTIPRLHFVTVYIIIILLLSLL